MTVASGQLQVQSPKKVHFTPSVEAATASPIVSSPARDAFSANDDHSGQRAGFPASPNAPTAWKSSSKQSSGGNVQFPSALTVETRGRTSKSLARSSDPGYPARQDRDKSSGRSAAKRSKSMDTLEHVSRPQEVDKPNDNWTREKVARPLRSSSSERNSQKAVTRDARYSLPALTTGPTDAPASGAPRKSWVVNLLGHALCLTQDQTPIETQPSWSSTSTNLRERRGIAGSLVLPAACDPDSEHRQSSLSSGGRDANRSTFHSHGERTRRSREADRSRSDVGGRPKIFHPTLEPGFQERHPRDSATTHHQRSKSLPARGPRSPSQMRHSWIRFNSGLDIQLHANYHHLGGDYSSQREMQHVFGQTGSTQEDTRQEESSPQERTDFEELVMIGAGEAALRTRAKARRIYMTDRKRTI
ncbi:hypothetical protein BKA93DRAFT_28379 [Sparassis latifolia]